MLKLKKSTLAIAGAVAVIGVAAIVLLVSNSGKNPENNTANATATVGAKPTLAVTTVHAKTDELADKLTANGNVAAWQETIVGAEVNGLKLIEVRVNVGDMVKKGQVLARFATDMMDAEVAQQKAQLSEIEAALAEAQANANRARNLRGSGAISGQQFDQYITAEKSAQARVAAALAVGNSTQIKSRHTQVLAPDDGVISARNATVGAIAQMGQELFRMIRHNRLEWRAEVTSGDLPRVIVGQSVTLFMPSGATLSGKVRMVAPTVDAQTRNALVYVDLPVASSSANGARAGMFAKGEFDLGKSTALTIPQQALVIRDGFNYVFALAADSRVTQIKIKVGRRSGDRVEVLEGLKADTSIVASGAGFLNDGDLVKVADTPVATAVGK